MSLSTSQITIGVTLFLASIAGSYTLGFSDRQDVISNLNNEIKNYKDLDKLNLKKLVTELKDNSGVIALTIKERREKDQLSKALDDSKKNHSKASEILLEEIDSLRTSLAESDSKLLERNNLYLELSSIISKKLTIKRNITHEKVSTIELIPDTYYLGLSSIYSNSVVLKDDGKSINIDIGQTKEFLHSGVNCYVRLKSADYVKDEAIFDYGCNLKS
jgi:hypothetical protein